MIKNDEKRRAAKALIDQGFSNPAIARRLKVDRSTVFRWRQYWNRVQESEGDRFAERDQQESGAEAR